MLSGHRQVVSLDYSRRVPRRVQAIEFAERRQERRFRGIFCNEVLGLAIPKALPRSGATQRIIRVRNQALKDRPPEPGPTTKNQRTRRTLDRTKSWGRVSGPRSR